MWKKDIKQPGYVYILRTFKFCACSQPFYHNLHTYLYWTVQCLEFSKSYVNSLKFNTCPRSVLLK